MTDHLAQELTLLSRLGIADLRSRYAQLFGETTRTGNKTWLVKRLAWRLQALAEGGLSERARRRAEDLATEADRRLPPPRPAPGSGSPGLPSKRTPRTPPAGTLLTRPYKGTTVQVRVLEHGFLYEGTIYPSLSAVATAIT